MDDCVEIIRSNKGGLKLIHKGYMYTVHKKRQNGGVRWRCTQRALHCKGSISTGSGEQKVISYMPHNHIPDPHSVAIARYKQAEEYTDVTSLVETEYDDVKAERRGNAIAKRVYQVHESNIRRWRKYKSSIMRDWRRDLKSLEALQEQRTPERPPLLHPSVTTTGTTSFTQPNPIMAVSQLLKVMPICKQSSSLSNSSTVNPQSPIPKDGSNDEIDSEEVCLRWNSHYTNMKKCFPSLLNMEKYIDCTITTDKGTIKCHQLILSSCSGYFDNLLSDISRNQHPVIFMKNVKHWVMKALIDFMYIGEILIDQAKLPDLLEVAEALEIKGLTGKKKDEKPVTPKEEPIVRDEVKEDVKPILTKAPIPSTSTASTQIPINKPVIITKISTKDDPMSLLTPAFYEEFGEKTETPVKKPPTKKIKKRKVEYEPPVPLFMLRKGTKSRPNVKMPKYYHNDFEPFTVKRISPSQASNNTGHNATSNVSRMRHSHRTTATVTSTPKRIQTDNVIVKIEAPDIEEHSLDYDPLELPMTPSEDDVNNKNTTNTINDKLLREECDKSERQQNELIVGDDNLKETKVFPQLKIITLKSESLLKTNQIKVVDTIKLKETNNTVDEDKRKET